MVPAQAATPALVTVGFLILAGSIREIDWNDFTIAIPAFLTMLLMPFTYSITNGIGIGFLSFCVLRVAAGRWREVPVALYAVAAVFAFYYLICGARPALRCRRGPDGPGGWASGLLAGPVRFGVPGVGRGLYGAVRGVFPGRRGPSVLSLGNELT